jgi:restriction endonuclease
MGSERERRQTLGRGLRLCVNQEGERVRDDSINILTVVASEIMKPTLNAYSLKLRMKQASVLVSSKKMRLPI